MHRNQLLEQLKAYRSGHQNELETVDRLCDFVIREVACFDRNTRHGHITGSAWIESADSQRVLLLLHRKLGRWLQPGGHADGDNDVSRVAQREVLEETGLDQLRTQTGIFDLDIHQIPARGDDPAHLHYDLRYRMIVANDQLAVGNHESLALRWFAITEVARWQGQPSIARMAMKSLGCWPPKK